MSWSNPERTVLEGRVVMHLPPLVDNQVGVVFSIDEVVSFLTGKKKKKTLVSPTPTRTLL